MARKLTFRQLLLTILAVLYDRSYKEIAKATSLSPDMVTYHLRRRREGEMKDDVFERILEAIQSKRGAVAIVTACLEALDSLESNEDLGEEELALIEEASLESARLTRSFLTAVLRRARTGPDFGVYPKDQDLPGARSRAGEQWERLKDLPEKLALAVVRVASELQNWALCERVCEESERAASRDLEEAEGLALLAREIAERVPGPEGWRNRVRGFAAGHLPNVLRVAGELKAAEAGFVEARQLWDSGSDPDMVLDPGRLLDLEASLRRDQRRFDEALALLDEAFTVGRRGAHVLIKKGFTLEVMGDYERAVETLLQAAPLVEAENDARLRYMRLFNLAVCKTHLGHYGEASQLLHQVRQVVTERGDENELSRVIWLDGRIAAGLGRTNEALDLLAQARQRFSANSMSYDVALALLEEAALLLEEGRTAEVRELAPELANLFQSKEVHREALAALQLFGEAVERETATSELAHRVLRFLFRARHDQGLRFTAS
jgi:tetratricopeptide (TPR) repeat protein